MDPFEHNAYQIRVIFGTGTVQRLPDELARLDVNNPLILSTPEQAWQAENLRKLIKGSAERVFTGATMHTPVDVTMRALQLATTHRVDSLVSVGGGSTIGLGKALALRTGMPHICIPTTYAGSEMTPILGQTEGGRKTTQRDPRIVPTAVIYDVGLTMTLPPGLTATSGVNAIAHAAEALYATDANPVTSLLAVEAIRSLAGALPDLVRKPDDTAARAKALYGAWLCGICCGLAMGLHHKLCHTLGGMLNLPHAETHTILLPHTLSYNSPAIPEIMDKLAGALPDSDGDPIRGLNLLLQRLGVKRALKDLGMKEESIARAAKEATANAYANPREILEDPIKALIQRAWAGEDAKADL
ncbi:hypothetical protein MRS44_011982 [Fusarium solani]|uniref:Maleylacetate reductase n=1 Tax=Fusarium solani TaxID=169388 RepID=A0A9P9G174_FUSSL|nr:uncharacterized protein B0J15DRAFT_530709 [Fusarium solani]KAH7230333.1 hypothetical protein B0J15DRAFT_530709 [Fusarium solani]KAJ3461115.1 hypothetical protein MRS44_011982 [Fusarium solani]